MTTARGTKSVLQSYKPEHTSVLFRALDHFGEDELNVCSKHLPTQRYRESIKPNSLVMGRYSVLPYYQELEEGLRVNNSKLINSYRQHRYVADMINWYEDLKDVTPKTWMRLQDVPDSCGPLVLKGETNSRKNKWSTHMFAANKREAVDVMIRLMDDPLLDGQNIYAREFVQLETFMVDPVSKQPITKEFRIFVLRGSIIGMGFYWSSHLEAVNEAYRSCSEVPISFVEKVVARVKDNINFFVVDVAKTASGEWIVVELNDGQQSGLSCVDAEELYGNIAKVLVV